MTELEKVIEILTNLKMRRGSFAPESAGWTATLVDEQSFRSTPNGAMSDDMMRVTIDVEKRCWGAMKRHLTNNGMQLNDTNEAQSKTKECK